MVGPSVPPIELIITYVPASMDAPTGRLPVPMPDAVRVSCWFTVLYVAAEMVNENGWFVDIGAVAPGELVFACVQTVLPQIIWLGVQVRSR